MSIFNSISGYCFRSNSCNEQLGLENQDLLIDGQESFEDQEFNSLSSANYSLLSSTNNTTKSKIDLAAEWTLKYIFCIQEGAKGAFDFTAFPITREIIKKISMQFKKNENHFDTFQNAEDGWTLLDEPNKNEKVDLNSPENEGPGKSTNPTDSELEQEVIASGEKAGNLSCLHGCAILCSSSVIVTACLATLAVVVPFELLKAIPLLAIYVISYGIGYGIYTFAKTIGQCCVRRENDTQMPILVLDESEENMYNEKIPFPESTPPIPEKQPSENPEPNNWANFFTPGEDELKARKSPPTSESEKDEDKTLTSTSKNLPIVASLISESEENDPEELTSSLSDASARSAIPESVLQRFAKK